MVTPRRASTVTVNAVPMGAVLSDTIIEILSSSRRSPSIGTQIRPRPYLAMKFTASGVAAIRRHHEVAFVLAVLVVHDERASAPGGSPRCPPRWSRTRSCRPPECQRAHADTCRSRPPRCSPPDPACSRPSVVTASVCGISMTSKLRSPSAATVRLTPSTATDPWGIRSGSRSRLGSVTRTRAVDSTRVTRVHGAHAVDVAEDQMTAEGAAEPQRTLEVDAVARGATCPSAVRRASPDRSRRRTRRGAPLDHREADAVHRDAGAELDSRRGSRAALDLEARDVARAARRARTVPTSSTIPVNISRSGPADHVGLDEQIVADRA